MGQSIPYAGKDGQIDRRVVKFLIDETLAAMPCDEIRKLVEEIEAELAKRSVRKPFR